MNLSRVIFSSFSFLRTLTHLPFPLHFQYPRLLLCPRIFLELPQADLARPRRQTRGNSIVKNDGTCCLRLVKPCTVPGYTWFMLTSLLTLVLHTYLLLLLPSDNVQHDLQR